MDYKEMISDVLLDMGFDISEGDGDSLKEFITDSMQFITFIVNLEEKFNFTFPDEYLLYDSITSIDVLGEIIDKAVTGK